MRIKTQAGFTMVEIFIALAIMAVGIYGVTTGMDSMRDIAEDTMILSANERQINNIADNIRTGLEQYQINFNYTDQSTQTELKVQDLPMAWDIGINARAVDCPNCKGKYGYTVQVLEAYRGLYMVTLRITHKDWSEPYRDYKFVVTLK